MYAETILEQLGQTILIINRVKNLVKDDIRKSLTMKLTSNKVKAQYLTVTLCENDTYTMECE
jgi:hypothetical protein